MLSRVARVTRSRFPWFLRPYSSVVVEDSGPVRIVYINRPEKRNCVNFETASRLWDAFKQFEEDSSAQVAVLAGKGGTFCAGYDLSEVASANVDLLINPTQFDSEGVAPMGPSRLQLSKPVVAAVSGYAVAGGMELALWCDLRVMEEGAKMGVFCRRFGVPLLDGGTVRLPALIGLSRAMDLILTGREVSASEAEHIGLANRVVPNGQSLQAAIELSKKIAAFPQQCMRVDRLSAMHSTYSKNGHLEALRFEFEQGSKVVKQESVAGAQRFVGGIGRGGQFE